MPLPLIGLGVSVAAVYLGNKLVQQGVRQQGNVKVLPGDCHKLVVPQDGAIVCCGIFELLQHTGIWLDGHIVELCGNGLIRGVSPQRFLQDRSGECIYVACDNQLKPIGHWAIAERASKQLYQYVHYHVLNNNCHRFVWQMVTGKSVSLTRFAELNQRLSGYFDSAIYWQPALI